MTENSLQHPAEGQKEMSALLVVGRSPADSYNRHGLGSSVAGRMDQLKGKSNSLSQSLKSASEPHIFSQIGFASKPGRVLTAFQGGNTQTAKLPNKGTID